jgi:cyanophycinase
MQALLFVVVVLVGDPGPLFVAGGGTVPPEVFRRALEAAGGERARVVVLAQASALADAGEGAVRQWREAGAKTVVNLELGERAPALAELGRADVIWLGGGDQKKLMAELKGAGALETVRRRVEAGAAAGGTSAGAAALSRFMITGEADLDAVRAGATRLEEGLGLWPGVIVDQHFLRRRRMNRLLAAVLDRPELVGVGIDERTAVEVRGTRITVMGEGNVMVLDVRGADRSDPEPGRAHAARNVRLHLLRAGMGLDLAAR